MNSNKILGISKHPYEIVVKIKGDKIHDVIYDILSVNKTNKLTSRQLTEALEQSIVGYTATDISRIIKALPVRKQGGTFKVS